MATPGLERALAILRLFRRDRSELAPAEVIALLGLPRSTVHALMNDMAQLGLLARLPSGRFMLDAGVLTLGYEYLASSSIPNLAEPVLEDLRNRTNWSTHLAVRQGTDIIYLSRFAARTAVTGNVSVGTSLPAHATMMGRLLLSDLEPSALRSLYENYEFTGDQGGSAPSLAELEQLIQSDRRCGFIYSSGYHEMGVRVVAAPVRDSTLKIVAAINATAVGSLCGDPQAVCAAVQEAAEAISRRLGAPASLPEIAPNTIRSGLVEEETR